MRTTPNAVCVLDVETRSTITLGRGGTNAVEYAKHPTTDVWLLRFQYDNDILETIHRWDPWSGEPVPDHLREHVLAGGVVSAHNAGFEHAIWNHLLVPRYGWPPLPITQMDDTAARLARCGMPRDLEKGAKAAGLSVEKDMEGNRLMKRMMRPRKIHTEEPDGADDRQRYTKLADGTWAEWWAVPERVARLGQYCDQDVLTQMALHDRLPYLPPNEWEVWQATMRANIRGCYMDTDFIHRARAILGVSLERYADELYEVTGGQVSSHSDINNMRKWVVAQDIITDSLDKEHIADILTQDDVPDSVRRVLQIRRESGKSSVAKFPAMALHTGEDGVSHDQLVYYGAQATGRWSAHGWQLHNLPARGPLKYHEAEQAVRLTEGRHPVESEALLRLMYDGSPVETLSMCLRSAIQARPGYDILGADYSNIEGRWAAFLAGEEWKLDAFRAYDAGEGPDLYIKAASGILGVAPDEVAYVMRNSLGKVSELSLQFQGGVGAFLSMAANYGVKIADHWTEIKASVDPEILAETHDAWESYGKDSGVDHVTWLAAEAVKRAWRARHPRIVQMWYDCEGAAIEAVRSPGHAVQVGNGKLSFLCKEALGQRFLLMRLPSGRCIWYAGVQLKSIRTPWGTDKDAITFMKVEGGRVFRASTYGGDLFQSAVQGGARDIMAHGWLTTEAAGYYPLFSVHDEMVSEIEAGKGDLGEFTDLLCRLPTWAQGCPVTAGGYRAKRFRKD